MASRYDDPYNHPIRQDTHPMLPTFQPPTSSWRPPSEYPPGPRPSTASRYETLPLNDPDPDSNASDAHTLVGDSRGSDLETGLKSSFDGVGKSGGYFLPSTPIERSRLGPERQKVYDKFDNKAIDKIGPEETLKEKLGRWRDEARQMGYGKWIMERTIRNGRWKITLAVVFVLGLIIISIALTERIAKSIAKPAEKIRDLKFGWLIPVGLFYILSFPPLFGAEILSTIVGLIWPLIKGWGLVSLGTILGEITVYFIVRHYAYRIGDRFANKSFSFATLSKVVGDGGFWIALLVRFSAFPTHLSTVMFGLTGLKVIPYTAASIISLPRWLPHVFNGVYLEKDGLHTLTTMDKVGYWGAQVLFTIITIATYHWLMKRMEAVSDETKQELKIRRAAALNAVSDTYPASSFAPPDAMEEEREAGVGLLSNQSAPAGHDTGYDEEQGYSHRRSISAGSEETYHTNQNDRGLR